MCSRVVTSLVIVGALVAACISAAPAAAAHDEAADSEDAHGGGEGDINPLSFQTDLALWTAVVFLLLLAVLWKFAWGPIADGLDKREQRIDGEIASAEKTNAEARQLLDEYQQKLTGSRDEIRQMLEDGRHDAEKIGRQIVDEAQDKARAEHQRALGEIELATSEALQELAQLSASLAVDLAGKIVDARLDPAEHTKLIEQAVANFSQPKPSSN